MVHYEYARSWCYRYCTPPTSSFTIQSQCIYFSQPLVPYAACSSMPQYNYTFGGRSLSSCVRLSEQWRTPTKSDRSRPSRALWEEPDGCRSLSDNGATFECHALCPTCSSFSSFWAIRACLCWTCQSPRIRWLNSVAFFAIEYFLPLM